MTRLEKRREIPGETERNIGKLQESEVLDAMNDIMEINPDLHKNKPMLRLALRQYLESGGMDIPTLGVLSEFGKEERERKARERDQAISTAQQQAAQLQSEIEAKRRLESEERRAKEENETKLLISKQEIEAKEKLEKAKRKHEKELEKIRHPEAEKKKKRFARRVADALADTSTALDMVRHPWQAIAHKWKQGLNDTNEHFESREVQGKDAPEPSVEIDSKFIDTFAPDSGTRTPPTAEKLKGLAWNDKDQLVDKDGNIVGFDQYGERYSVSPHDYNKKEELKQEKQIASDLAEERELDKQQEARRAEREEIAEHEQQALKTQQFVLDNPLHSLPDTEELALDDFPKTNTDMNQPADTLDEAQGRLLKQWGFKPEPNPTTGDYERNPAYTTYVDSNKNTAATTPRKQKSNRQRPNTEGMQAGITQSLNEDLGGQSWDEVPLNRQNSTPPTTPIDITSAVQQQVARQGSYISQDMAEQEAQIQTAREQLTTLRSTYERMRDNPVDETERFTALACLGQMDIAEQQNRDPRKVVNTFTNLNSHWNRVSLEQQINRLRKEEEKRKQEAERQQREQAQAAAGWNGKDFAEQQKKKNEKPKRSKLRQRYNS